MYKIICLFLLSLAFSYAISAQDMAADILYKANKWVDIKQRNASEGMRDFKNEKVEVLKTSSNIKVTLGTKVFNYTIINATRASSTQINYSVALSNKKYTLSITSMLDNNSVLISISGLWKIPDITDITTIGRP